MRIQVCRYKNAGVAGYAKAFLPVQSDLQTSEWCSYFENDVLVILIQLYSLISAFIYFAHTYNAIYTRRQKHTKKSSLHTMITQSPQG